MSSRPAKTAPAPAPRIVAIVLAAVLVSLIGVILVRTAWLSDDVMISLRTVLNVSHGYGLTWNLGERVQVYTHPLWLGLLTAASLLTGELFLTTIWLSIGVTLLAVIALCLQVPRSANGLLPALACLLCSRAFIDYGTSGLENPLSHLLLALVVLVLDRQPPRRGAALALVALICGLLVLNRLDLVLVTAPLLALAVRQAGLRARPTLGWLLLGGLPFLAWIVFSASACISPTSSTSEATSWPTASSRCRCSWRRSWSAGCAGARGGWLRPRPLSCSPAAW